MATGKYVHFVPPLIQSAREHFCKEHQITYFVFTDGILEPASDVVQLYQTKVPWPYATMMRYHAYASYRDVFSQQDYLFACDADMLFVDTVGSEILGDRVATLHPGFIGKRGSYETNPISTAYISDQEGEFYFAGGFYGGTVKEFLHIIDTNIHNIEIDLSRQYIAVWHDESHWNRYCIDCPPTLILYPAYLYPESWVLPYPRKLLALDKNHAEYQQ